LSFFCTHILKAKEPEKYSVDQKPPELDLYNNGVRLRAPARHAMGQSFDPPMHMPYSYYPPPALPPVWYGQGPQPPFGFVPPNHVPVQAGVAVAVNQAVAVTYPTICDWLEYCDRHPGRCGEDFTAHAERFDKEGYRRMNQLAGNRITVEKLSEWLQIGKGTADLLIGYADEDIGLIKAGAFTMTLPDV
jgi:hypothetical protein